MQAYNKPGYHSRNNVAYSSTSQIMALELVGEQVCGEMALTMNIPSLVEKGKPRNPHTLAQCLHKRQQSSGSEVGLAENMAFDSVHLYINKPF